MKYLKSYTLYERFSKETKLFESVESDVIKKDIEEICYDITDYGKFRVNIAPNPQRYSKNRWIILISLADHMDYDGFLLSEVEDTLMRIKEYLGLGRFVNCEVLLVGEQNRLRLNYISDEDRKNNINFPTLNGIEDLGFKVEYNRGGVGEVTRIYIEKFDTYGFSNEPRPLPYIPGQEFVLALQHLISYVSQDYDIEIESICDSQCIDHLSSKSEDGLIENDATIIGNYKVPIDYIKIVISNKD